LDKSEEVSALLESHVGDNEVLISDRDQVEEFLEGRGGEVDFDGISVNDGFDVFGNIDFT
jgi:hypothetical protein